MRHAKKRLQLNRFTSWHKATLTGLVKNLLVYQSIKTTLARAKAASPQAERLISLAKKNSLSARRAAFRVLGSHKLVEALFEDIAARFSSRNSGYTRIIRLSRRRGDNAPLVILELTEIKKKEPKKPKKEEKKETRPRTETAVKEERHPETKKPAKKFLGGIRNIFKKERDAL